MFCAGAWVKLRNIGAFATHGQLQAAYHAASKWLPWPADGEDVAALLEEDARRRAANNIAGMHPFWHPIRNKIRKAGFHHQYSL